MRTLIRRREWPVWVIKTWGKRDLFKAFVALIRKEDCGNLEMVWLSREL